MLDVFYAVLTARVIFTAKTSLDVFSPSREQVWTFSVLGGRIYEMRCLFVVVGLNARCPRGEKSGKKMASLYV